MSTHSIICIKHKDSIESIYSHWDGYLSYNGKILQKYYDLAKTKQLMKLGNISNLGSEIGNKHDFDQKQEYVDDTSLNMRIALECTAYGRDREETKQESKIFNSIKNLHNHYDENHYYILKDEKWYYVTGRDIESNEELILLQDAITEDAETE